MQRPCCPFDGPDARIIDESTANGLRRIAANAEVGELTLAGGVDLLTQVPFENRGLLTIGENSTFTATGAFEQADGVTALEATTSNVTATASQVRVTGGSLGGVGSAGPAVVASGGEVAPGVSPGTFTAAGTYQQLTGGSLSVEIGGSVPGSTFDVLEVSGSAALGGTLSIDTVDGFSPSLGDTFRILTSASRTGEFVSLLGTDLGNGLAYTAQYDATGVTLAVTDFSLSINDVSVAEGNGGTVNATFTVTLSDPSANPVTVDYATRDDSAVDPDDYTAANGTLTFDAGQTTKTITIAVNGDVLDEDDETFAVDLSDATNAPISNGEGIGTIQDDDPSSTVSIAPDEATITEGNAGFADATFTVTLTPATGRTVSVAYATAIGSATSPADFAAVSGVVTFDPGETEQTITVGVRGDLVIEPTETFFVDLSSPLKVALGTSRATGTILDDDAASISITGASVDEGNSGTTDATFVVSLSAPATETVRVDFATADLSATAPVDYLPASGTVTWTAGETSKTITVQVVGDTEPESDETFEVLLTNAVNATIVDPDATGTIADGGDIIGTPDYQMLISPRLQVVPPGGTVRYTIRVIGLFGFDEPVTLSTPDLPTGFTATFSVNPIDPPGLSILTITADPDAILGEDGFTIRGIGGGITHEVQANTTLDFGLVPICFGAVEGFVTDEETGAPIEGAVISVVPFIETDANGYYVIDEIALDEFNNPIENFHVQATKLGYWTAGGRDVVFCDGVTRIDIELLALRPASVSGTVVEGTPDATDPTIIHPTGPPIADARVEVRLFGADQSAADGAFTVELEKLNPRNAPIEDAHLEVVADGYWARPAESIGGLLSSPYPIGTLEPDEHMTSLVVPLVKKCTGTLTGIVTDEVTGLAIANAPVTVAWPIEELDVKTDAAGRFTYPGVLLGHNNTPLMRGGGVSSPGYTSEGFEFLMSTCRQTQRVEIELALAPPPIFGTLEGHVYDAVTGDPLAGAQVFTPICATPPGTTCTATDSNGFYRLANVPLVSATGPTQVTFFSRLDPNYYATFETFAMSANQTTEHDFRLSLRKFARLTGVVTDRSTGEPIVGAGACCLPSGVLTDASGRYLTPPIELPAPGDPTAIQLRFSASGYWPQTKSKAVHASADPFVLDFDLLPVCEDATVQGTIVNAATQATISGATVSGGGQSDITGADGTYQLEHLRVGTDNSPIDVEITASAPGFHPLRKTVKVFCNATLTIDFGRQPNPATIIVRKTTDPAGSQQEFAFAPTWTTGFELAGGATKTFSNLTPGSGYSVAETVPAGWQQQSATCSDGSPVTNIALAAGETVTCTFTNRQLATLIVRKTTDPSPDQSATSFAFTAGGGLSPASFSLADGGSRTFADLVPGSGFSLAETLPAGWQQQSATCSDGSPVTNIALAAGESVTCTFVNAPIPPDPGTIIVAKTTDPAGSDVGFAFTRSWGDGFTLKHGQTKTFSNLTPGSGYSVAETVPAGWQQQSATCSDGSPVTNIALAAGESVTCTFTNVQDGGFLLRKVNTGGPATDEWAFTIAGGGPFAGCDVTAIVLAGAEDVQCTADAGHVVTITELDPGERYLLTAIDCRGATNAEVDLADRSVQITLRAGEITQCAFTNTFQEPPDVLLVIDEDSIDNGMHFNAPAA